MWSKQLLIGMLVAALGAAITTIILKGPVGMESNAGVIGGAVGGMIGAMVSLRNS